MNDRERSLWVDNDEGLYTWWRQSRLTKGQFIRQNRKVITEAIERARDGARQHPPGHARSYQYGGNQ